MTDSVQAVLAGVQELLAGIPVPVQWAVFGEKLPQMRFAGMSSTEQEWRNCGEQCARSRERISALRATTAWSAAGVTGTEIAEALAALESDLDTLQAACISLADRCRAAQADTVKSLIEMLVFGTIVAFQVATLVAGGGIGAIPGMALLAKARGIFLGMLEKLVAKLGARGAAAAGVRVGVLGGAFGSGSAALDLGIQALQVGFGARAEYDLATPAFMALQGVGSVAGGHLAAPFTSTLAPLLGRAALPVGAAAGGVLGTLGAAAITTPFTGQFALTGTALFSGIAQGALGGLTAATPHHPPPLPNLDMVRGRAAPPLEYSHDMPAVGEVPAPRDHVPTARESHEPIRLDDHAIATRVDPYQVELPLRAEVPLRLFHADQAAPLTMRPGVEIPLGRGLDSPLGATFGTTIGLSPRHASLGLTDDSLLYLRDNGSRTGTFVNGDRLAPGTNVRLYNGDTVEMGLREFTIDMDPSPATLSWSASSAAQRTGHQDITIQPGQEHSPGDRDRAPVLGQWLEQAGLAPDHATQFMDPDGRLYVRDNGSREGTFVNGRRILAHGPVQLYGGDQVQLGPGGPRAFVGTRPYERPPVDLQLEFGGLTGILRVEPRQSVSLGSEPGAPFAGLPGVRPGHATVTTHADGTVWIRTRHWTWVNDVLMSTSDPTRLHDGDTVRVGERRPVPLGSDMVERIGPAQEFRVKFVEPPRLGPEKQPLSVWIGDRSQGRPVRIEPGTHVNLGRSEESPIGNALRGDRTVDPRQASLGMHPSGRVWLRNDHPDVPVHLNGLPIPPAAKSPVDPGDRIRIGSFETTVDFSAPTQPHTLWLVDRTAATLESLDHLALVPPNFYDRLMDYINSFPDGGITIGQRPLGDLPGLDPIKRYLNTSIPDWEGFDSFAGLAVYDHGRLLVDSERYARKTPVLLHEIGHFGDRILREPGEMFLRSSQEFQRLNERAQRSRASDPKRTKHYDEPGELLAEGFGSWLTGPEAMDTLVNNDYEVAREMEEFYERKFGPRP